ncbi:MAG TPA: hypothetical protein VK797_30080 [Tepidisphaeraceae bacterium]|nr:hypothetical protein [Tepidisphaeraceae bacterium]
MSVLQYSQQWQAADIFRAAPLRGPGPLCDGARRAVVCLLALPLAIAFAAIAWLMLGNTWQLLPLLPGVIALPVYALIPNLGGKAVPPSSPAEESKSAGQGVFMMLVIICSVALSGIALWAWSTGWFAGFLVLEIIFSLFLSLAIKRSVTRARWASLE